MSQKFNFLPSHLRDAILDVANNKDFISRWPKLARIFYKISIVLFEIIMYVEFDFSKQSAISNNAAFEEEMLNKLYAAIRTCEVNNVKVEKDSADE